jgi:hypothetical protein
MKFYNLISILLFITETSGFMLNSSLKKRKTYLMYYGDIDWDAGEVSWDILPASQYTTSTENDDKNIPHLNRDSIRYNKNAVQYEKTPLYEKIKADQKTIASASIIAKSSYKELFNLDAILSEINNDLNHHRIFTPSEILFLTFLSGITFVYNKTNEVEKERLKRLYKFNAHKEYFETYVEVRKITMAIFIILTCVLTKNVQIAE